ncbi:MAG TPA: hypothetical protein DHW82_12790 [Spirochaetia bacterium]|nr:MAG: hypothetical protein A2Y41_03250 [Spirochaetes bacterium GWB1_36_13]HCL57866.1 hypothetical protein [Spirochaetia bacterium]
MMRDKIFNILFLSLSRLKRTLSGVEVCTPSHFDERREIFYNINILRFLTLFEMAGKLIFRTRLY